MFPPPLLAELSHEITGLLFFFVVMTAGAVISITALYFHHQRQRLWHDTARLAMEKGQPMPPAPSSWEEPAAVMKAVAEAKLNKQGRPRRPRWIRDLRGGLVMLATGAGVYLTFARDFDRHNGVVMLGAYIPAFIGAALILSALVGAAFSPRDHEMPPPPQA